MIKYMLFVALVMVFSSCVTYHIRDAEPKGNIIIENNVIEMSALLSTNDQIYITLALGEKDIYKYLKGDSTINYNSSSGNANVYVLKKGLRPFPKVCSDILVEYVDVDTLIKIPVEDINLSINGGDLDVNNNTLSLSIGAFSYENKRFKSNQVLFKLCNNVIIE